jgi:integrase
LWNKEAGKVKTSAREASTINHYLDRIRTRLMECYSEALLDGKIITGHLIKNAYFGINDQQVKTTNDLFEYHNTTCQSKLSDKTFQLYLITQKLWKEFLFKKTRSEAIAVKNVDYTLLVDFELHLRKREGRLVDTKLCNNTAMKHLARIRKMMNLANQLGWISSNPFKSFRLKYDKSERGFLNQEQLQEIENYSFPSSRLQTVADLFIFSCYTGIAYIDLQNLTKDNLIKGIDGQTWLSFHRHKTNIAVKLPLLLKAQNLLKKYEDFPPLEGKPWLFPRISNQKANTYLKEIAALCGIKINLTFHMARHTFATTVTLTNGVPIETVSKILGHTDLKTTQIYAKVIENKVADDMLNLRNKLEKPDNQKNKKVK